MSKPATAKDFSEFDLGTAYLKCLDLLRDNQFKEYNLTITDYFPPNTLEKAGNQGRIDKPCIGFKETTKKMVLSITNAETLHLICGSNDHTKIIGRKIRIGVRFVKFGRADILGLRILPNEGLRMPLGLKKRLGEKAVWEGEDTSKQEQKDGVPPDGDRRPVPKKTDEPS